MLEYGSPACSILHVHVLDKVQTNCKTLCNEELNLEPPWQTQMNRRPCRSLKNTHNLYKPTLEHS